MTITNERIEFTGSTGEKLAARLDRPISAPRAYALFAHCFTCSKEIFAASRISMALAEKGIAVLRFDFTGLGSSSGEFANTNFSSNVDDLIAAANFLKTEHQPPAILIGHSLGGAAVLAAAGKIPEARAVVSLNAPCDPEHIQHLLKSSAEEIEKDGEAQVCIGGRNFKISQQFLDDLAQQKMEEKIRTLRKALLIMHSPQDEIVGIENARHIFQTALHPKSFVALEGANHLLTRREDASYAAGIIAAWVTRYLEPDNNAAEKPPKAIPGEVIVAETGEGRFIQAIAAGTHIFRADEPKEQGGDDTGPSPYDLLMAALGACTTMTIRMVAERKKIPLEKVSVRLNHKKIHAEDCASCETESGKIDRFERTITLQGGLSQEEREKLLEIADKCPVHRTLHSEVTVETKLED